jgi:hypothetical protein
VRPLSTTGLFASALLACHLLSPASAAAAVVTYEFTFLVQELEDIDGWTGLLGAEEVVGTFSFDDATPGMPGTEGGTTYEGAVTHVAVTFPALSFDWEPTPLADLNRILVVDDTLLPSSGFRDTWVAAAIQNEATLVGETFAIGLGDEGTDAFAGEQLSPDPPDWTAFASTDVEVHFDSPEEAWRVSGRVLGLVAVPEPAAPAATALAGLVLAGAARHRRRRGPQR